MRVNSLLAAGVGAAALLALSVPAHAVTFFEYSATSSSPNLIWTKPSGTLSTTGMGASAAVDFSFLNPTLSAAFTNMPATFTLSATSMATAFVNASGDYVQPSLSGTFSFIYTGPTVTVGKHTYASGTDLLSGTFSGAEITGAGSAGNVKDSVLSGGTITYTSGISSSQLAFSNKPGADRGFSLALTSTTPIFAKEGKRLRSFSADSSGQFSATLSAGGGGGGVPEPATWAMMLAGFGLAGYALRRRRVSLNLA